MRNDFMMAINQVCAERKLAREVVLAAVEAALISAYKRNFGAVTDITVQIDPNTGAARVFAEKEVVENPEDVKTQISLDEARRLEPEASLGQFILVENTPGDFGRIAAQTAKQVILQRIREAERDAIYTSYADSAGDIAHGTIQSQDMQNGDVMVSLDGTEAVLPLKEQVPTERYRRGTRLRAYVIDVRKGSRGPQITLSRRNPALLRRLLELEVPEIYNGVVEIKSIAREPGSRSKVAVHTAQEGVDPVGSCVGVRGGRIQNVVNELEGEKIDVVQWSSDTAAFIASALSPAKVMNVILDDDAETGKTATVIVPDRQLSLAIGKEGQNARLAAKLTGWRIDIKSATEAAEETMGRFEGPVIAPGESDLLVLAEEILRKQGALTDVQRGVVDQAVKTALDVDLPWPEEEKPSPAQAAPEIAPQPEAASGPAEEHPVVAEPPPEVGLEAPSEPEAQPAVDLSVPPIDESELVPTFVGEQIEDSLGWVTTQAVMEEALDFEQEVALQEEVWEEVEDWQEVQKTSKKKKGKKVKGKRAFDAGDDWARGGGSNKGRKYKPPRSRG
ncbi:MAG: transcription termination/antitermination protein NusA [Anaerolineae bacterium]|nr:transcription termination/antitermination protein NusA [Anaerolineae bacterium]